MPIQPTVLQIHFNSILTSLSAAVATFKVIADGINAPFLGPILYATQSLLAAVQMVKKHKDDCIQMLEQIHGLLYAIIQLHVAETEGELSPNMLHNMGKFTVTLHKIHAYIEAQQERNLIRQFFRQGEMSTLLKGCHLGLEEAIEAFKVQRIDLSSDVMGMQEYAQKTHQEILEMISALSDGTGSDRTSMPNIVQFTKQLKLIVIVAFRA
ncbi:hypothetical protein DFH09DRAFT_1319352 [Mycena vulgaris]|nr:hypothetical protein DFH09DRAFT_1319352 [Mycena vulgaris]